MRKYSLLFVGVVTLWAVPACSKSGEPEGLPFGPAESTLLASDFPGEVSGMADSYSRPGTLWLIQDRKNAPVLLELTHSGLLGAGVSLEGVQNQDWEDLAIGPGPMGGRKYLYVGDIGDNDALFDVYSIYRLPEPVPGITKVAEVDRIRFRYPDALHHNAEALLVDPVTADLLVITKENPATVYRLRSPYSTSEINVAEKLGSLRQAGVTGATLSANGNEILLRTYTALYYWERRTGESLFDAILKEPKSLPVQAEPQGEAVCFKSDGSGFFTLSEKAGLPLQLKLHFYPRR